MIDVKTLESKRDDALHAACTAEGNGNREAADWYFGESHAYGHLLQMARKGELTEEAVEAYAAWAMRLFVHRDENDATSSPRHDEGRAFAALAVLKCF